MLATWGDCFSYTTMESYHQHLQDPKWQKKRLGVFSRDNWRCRCCNVTDVPLNAHHLYYVKGNKPWEYDDEAIVTVCYNCHEVLHKELNKLSGIIAFKILSGEITEIDFSKYFNKISHGRK